MIMPSESRARDSKRAGRLIIWIPVLLIIMFGMVYFYYIYPEKSIGPEQPISFSHRVHAGVKEINCRFCHSFTGKSREAGIPVMEKCFFCHKYIIPSHPQLLKELEHFKSGNAIQWVKIFYVPDFVKFRHQPHIKWANLDCTECHGDIKAKDRLQSVNLQMGFCIECHKKKNAQTDCWLACHH
jgi:hypothetical protein